MPGFQFSTIQVVPHDPGRHAAANVGVILYDPSRNIAYRKLTDNWQEVQRVTGFRYNPGSAEAAEQGPFDVEDAYLENLARDQFMDSLTVTPPKTLMPFDTYEKALRWAYGSQVSIAALADEKNGRPDAADMRLRKKIAGVHFPKGCYKHAYKFDLDRPPAMRFPNVFLANGEPYKALFAVSLAAASASAIVKKRICEIETIKKQTGTGATFAMCTIQAKQEIDKGKPHVRDSLDLAREWDVESITWDRVDWELAKIRRHVSPLKLQVAGHRDPAKP